MKITFAWEATLRSWVLTAGNCYAFLFIMDTVWLIFTPIQTMKDSIPMKTQKIIHSFSTPTPIHSAKDGFKGNAYLLIHGIGQQPEHWYTEALNAFPLEQRDSVVPFYWADILNQGVASKTLRLVSKLLGVALRYYTVTALKHPHQQANDLIQDAMARLVIPLLERWLDYAGDVLSYATVRVNAFERLNSHIHQLEAQGYNVVLIAHSLGSVLAFEFCTLPLPECVKGLITLGSPLDREPIKHKTLERTGGRVALPIPWHNVWGSLDLICCWRPWHSGEMNTFLPGSQQRCDGQGHNLEAYIRQLPASLWQSI
jgi:pimeloyl-ACP methyl ester carboxylesterase